MQCIMELCIGVLSYFRPRIFRHILHPSLIKAEGTHFTSRDIFSHSNKFLEETKNFKFFLQRIHPCIPTLKSKQGVSILHLETSLAIARNFLKSPKTLNFSFNGYTLAYLMKSSMKVSKYKFLPKDCMLI